MSIQVIYVVVNVMEHMETTMLDVVTMERNKNKFKKSGGKML